MQRKYTMAKSTKFSTQARQLETSEDEEFSMYIDDSISSSDESDNAIGQLNK